MKYTKDDQAISLSNKEFKETIESSKEFTKIMELEKRKMGNTERMIGKENEKLLIGRIKDESKQKNINGS